MFLMTRDGLQKQHYILGSRHHQTKNWRTGLYCPGTEKHQPKTPYELAQKMPFEWIRGITTKYRRRADRRNIRSLRSRNSPSLSRSTTLGKKKKIYATIRRESQKEEVLTVFFFSFSKKKKMITLGRWVLWDRNLPALYYNVRKHSQGAVS